MRWIAWCLLLCASPPAASAAELFRCVGGDGQVSYQDTPCGEGSRLTKTIVVPNTTVDLKSKPQKEKPMKERAPTRSSKAGRATSTTDARSRQRDACTAARAEQQRVLDGLGLARTFDQLRALGDKVQAACKGL